MKREHNSPTRTLSRRAALQALLATGGAGLLAACGAAPSTPASEATAAPAAAPTQAPAASVPESAPTNAPAAASSAGDPKRGGIYRTITNEQFGNLDSALAFNYIDWWLSYNVLYNTLYRFDPQGKLYPELADGMPTASADGLTYTVKIKPGVKFHNGREMTADDVKFTFERNLYSELNSPGAPYITDIVGYEDVTGGKTKDLAGIKVVDPTTLSFTLKGPNTLFPAILSITTFGVVPRKEATDAGADFGSKVIIGTGPFKLKEWRGGELLSLVRHDEYFKPGKPYLDGMDMQLNAKPENAILQWEAGDLEFVNIESIPPAELPRIREDEKLKALLKEGPSLVFYRLAMAGNMPPFDNLKVRQALAHAIDKQTLALRSQAGAPLDGVFPGTAQYNPNFTSKYSYDPEKAKALLQEAGVAEGTKFTLVASALSQELSEMIQADLKAIGIDADLQGWLGSGVSYNDVFKPKVESGEIPLSLRGFGPDYPDAASFVQSWLLCTDISPKAQFCDAKIADLYAQAAKLPLDDAKRTELFHQIEEITVNEQVYFVPLYARSSLLLSQAYVRGDEPDPMLTNPTLENVWFDK